MRALSSFATIAAALSLAALPADAASAGALGYDDARHLLNRTGFGATQAEIEHYVGMSREDAARALLATARSAPVTLPPPAMVATGPLQYPRRGAGASDEELKMFRRQQVREGLELRGWWIGEMLSTPSPLTERMTLFWHNHFVSSQQKVKLTELMYRQNVTLRAQALGNFGTMLHAVARDPAMIVYLDSAQNRKGAPNENFARELMELFTLGEGNYGERDVKEAARAFTGWSVDRERGEFVFRRALHDYGSKTVLGRTGNFDGDDVIDILLAQPSTAEFVSRKLWREFVSPDPDAAEVKRIAARFRESGYDIKTALYALLTSDAFYARENRGTLVKSPVDLVVGSVRQFGMHPGDTIPFAVATAGMGQNLFAPPNVRGWPGQDTWINTSSLLARKQFLDRLMRAEGGPAGMSQVMPGDTMMASDRTPWPDEIEQARRARPMRAVDRGARGVQFDSAAWFAQWKAPADARKRSDDAVRLLFAVAPQTPPQATEPLAMLRELVLDAAYELK
ncbi:MAG TPA: DUF1800 domain-containing protein [Casimicrobiaceae bacterium]|jgi:uncharacterized protein (DUF1800 family)|nr:DUF1800 domain-containing protein [Casimicrobiaceae bacterium]